MSNDDKPIYDNAPMPELPPEQPTTYLPDAALPSYEHRSQADYYTDLRRQPTVEPDPRPSPDAASDLLNFAAPVAPEQRRQSYVQPAPSRPALNVCPECGGLMHPGTLHANEGVSVQPLDKRMFDFRYSNLNAMVCENCGFTKFYAADPSQIVPRS